MIEIFRTDKHSKRPTSVRSDRWETRRKILEFFGAERKKHYFLDIQHRRIVSRMWFRFWNKVSPLIEDNTNIFLRASPPKISKHQDPETSKRIKEETKLYDKYIYKIRNIEVLTSEEISKIRPMTNEHKMNIIIRMNHTMKVFTQLVD